MPLKKRTAAPDQESSSRDAVQRKRAAKPAKAGRTAARSNGKKMSRVQRVRISRSIIDLAAEAAPAAGIEIVLGDKALLDTHRVDFKGADGDVRWRGSWGKISIPKQDKYVISHTYYLKVVKGTYEFFKQQEFTGTKLTIRPGDTWPTADFQIRHIRSWRGV